MTIRFSIRILILFFLLYYRPFAANNAAADNIYKWTDSGGKTHYSTTPYLDSKPATLPKIQRENLDKKIETIKENTPLNCGPHGGVDCSLGQDIDGSVICFDNYKESILPFRFACVEAKLKALGIVVLGKENNIIGKLKDNLALKKVGKKPELLQVSIRNSSNIKAFGVKIFFVFSRKSKYLAIGPSEVAPFGIADYSLDLTTLRAKKTIDELSKAKLHIICTNCS